MTLTRRHGLRLALGATAAGAFAASAFAGSAFAGSAGAGAAAAGLSAVAPQPPGSRSLRWRERALLAFGTTVHLRAGHADAARADAGLDAAVAAVLGVEQRMSLFRPDSDIVRLNRDGVLHQPHADWLALLPLALKVAEQSGGRFDPTVQPLWLAWQRAAARGGRLAHADLRAARALVGWRGVQVSADGIAFARPGMGLTLNGIAQGHAADAARAALLLHGVHDALLNTGEWLPLGSAPEGGPWRLGIADPHAAGKVLRTLLADGRAIACSSDDKLAFSADRRDHHILDPRSGRSPTALSQVVVAAPSAALADALTKVVFMDGLDDALATARRWGVDVLAVSKTGRWVASAGLLQ